MNELHDAARGGSTERTLTVLSRGVIDIDQGDPTGMTPLMLAAAFGYLRVVRILLNKRANVAKVNDDGFAALRVSAQAGHLAAAKLLVKAGADLEAKTSTDGSTPLILAAQQGHPEVMGMLIQAGANPNSRMLDGATSLYIAAQHGHVDTTKVLLRAKANPLLTHSSPLGVTFIPLDIAAQRGNVEAARELIQEHGIQGCRGASGGIQALQMAAHRQQVEIMSMLTRAGVVDTGAALVAAASFGRESSMKFLLQQQQEWKTSGQGAAYLETSDPSGRTPLLCSVEACRSCSPRITRLLVDAGADTTRAVRLKNARGVVYFDDTPLALTNIIIRGKKIGGEVATEEQLHSLEATRRLLLRVEAVHAVSWLWTSENAPSVTHTASKGKSKTKVTPTPLTSMLPILRRRAGRPRVLLAALFRNSKKP